MAKNFIFFISLASIQLSFNSQLRVIFIFRKLFFSFFFDSSSLKFFIIFNLILA